jgi:protein SCO1/2
MNAPTRTLSIALLVVGPFVRPAPPPCCETPAPPAAALPSDSLAHLEGASWKDQNGTPFAFAELAGRPRLVSLFFSHCAYACPRLIEDARRAQTELAGVLGQPPPIWLFSLDHVRDTPPVLATYAKGRELAAPHWRFFHGAEADVTELAAALGVQFRRDARTGDFGHTSRIVLLDAAGRPVAAVEGAGPDLAPLRIAAAALR